VTHGALLATLALDMAHERQRRGERLARLLPATLPEVHGATRRRLARAAAGLARWLDDQVVLSDAPRTSHGV
jgi:hypothetical protein